jgi:Fe-S-cluster-containing dehydrogenase component
VRTTSEKQWTVVNRHETSKGEVFVKTQCMHCWQPACAAACLTNAIYKTPEGPVVWEADKCMGWGDCMISCPFDIPKFEYHDWNPKIQKRTLRSERLAEGKKSACVEACPTDALMFGSKRELMEAARVRIYNHPDDYVHEIYGEHLVGGTAWLYLSAVPFAELLEVLGFVLVPCVLFVFGARNRRLGVIRVASIVTLVGVALNRINIPIIAFNWDAVSHYYPTWMEVVVTLMVVFAQIWVFRWIVLRLPVLREAHELPNRRTAGRSAAGGAG